MSTGTTRTHLRMANAGTHIIPRKEGMHHKAQLLEHISASSCRMDWKAGYIRYVVMQPDFQHQVLRPQRA
jgi:hypothetical protein